jgi:NTP pyrophosphatase (non-canonical NTP hydrolase)
MPERDLTGVPGDELAREVQRRTCASQGHDWEIVTVGAGPVALVCPCGAQEAVGVQTSAPETFVRLFHEHFGLPIGDTSRTTNKLRRDLIEQEAGELTEAIDAYDADPTPDNLAKVAHEGVDVLFAVIGTNLTLGIDTDRAAYQVFLSLMTRQGADETGKVRKGPNYVPPDMRPALPGGSGG